MNYDVCVVGGAGHVGLPLAIVLAANGFRVLIQDRNQVALEQIQRGELPFQEEGALSLLQACLSTNHLTTTTDVTRIRFADTLIVTIGTPVDEFLNPEVSVIREWLDDVLPLLRDDQLIILRSTLYPGTTSWVARYLSDRGKTPLLAFCPERIAQGRALAELKSLPQIVSGTTPEAAEAAERVFARIAPETVRLSPLEAEFAKLFANAHRYINFAISNQFYMLASQAGVDFNQVWHGVTHHYPRMAHVPSPGFTAGPCLFKDTMQLAAFSNHQFGLGHAAMLVNEGLPRFLVESIKPTLDLSQCTAGILGMAFKADVDDPRASLSYKLKKILKLECRQVLCSDPYVKDADLVPVDDVLARSDVIFIATPHAVYRQLSIPSRVRVVDVWNLFPASTER